MAFADLIPDLPEIESVGVAYERVAEEIKTILLSVDPMHYSASKGAGILSRVDSKISRLNVIAIKHTNRFIPKAYNQMKARSISRLKELGRKEESQNDSYDKDISSEMAVTKKYLLTANRSIHKTAAKYLIAIKRISKPLAELREFGGAVLSDDEIRIFLEKIQRAVAAGDSRNMVSAMILERLKEDIGESNLIEVNGRFFNARKYSMLVSRTEMRRVQSQAVKTTCARYQNDLVEVSDHGTTTEICEPYEGETYSLSGSDNTYALLPAEPPFHPNCQHYLSPTSKAALALRK